MDPLQSLLLEYLKNYEASVAKAKRLLGPNSEFVHQLESLAEHIDVVHASTALALEKQYTEKLAEMEYSIKSREITAVEKLVLAKSVAEELKADQAEKLQLLKARIEQYQRQSADQLLVLAAFNASEELQARNLMQECHERLKQLLEKLHKIVPNTSVAIQIPGVQDRQSSTFRDLELLNPISEFAHELESLAEHIDDVSTSTALDLEKLFTEKLADLEQSINAREIAAEEKMTLAKSVAKQLKADQAEKLQLLKARIEQYQRRSAEQLLVLAAFNASEELRARNLIQESQEQLKQLLAKLHKVVPDSNVANKEQVKAA